MTGPSRSQRIPEIDGLRTLAILGVLYAHVYGFGCGNIPWRIAGVDINKALTLFGTGVDLFFVISGFCMYMAYVAKADHFSGEGYWTFLKGRFRRIYPAWLAAVVFAALVWLATYKVFPLDRFVEHLAFVHILFPDGNKLAEPFWSLATEWHFYLVLPFLVLAGQRFGYVTTLLVVGALSLTWRFFEGLAHPASDFQMPSRLTEFLVGVAVARWHLGGGALPAAMRGAGGVAIGFVVMLAGRVLMTDAAQSSSLGLFARAIDRTVLSAGYALMLWSVVASDSLVAAVLRAGPVQWLGRVSYSFYLWHWFPGLWIGAWVTSLTGGAVYAPILAFVLSTAVVSVIAAASYKMFEARYFSGRAASAPPRASEAGLTT